jgi:ribosome maturation factor RimP
MADIKQKLLEILEEKFGTEGYSSFFVVDILLSADEHLQVFLDNDNGLLLEHCVEISRFLEHYIEENNLLGEKYTIDVSSPGVGAPLILKRQYQKNIGRLISVELSETHVNAKGTLVEVHDDYIVLEYTEKVLVEEGKKKKKEVTLRKNIPFEHIQKAVIKIVF